jgi:uncharacterized protein YbjT (DUF2867 family)
LVTGASGRVGGAVVRALAGRARVLPAGRDPGPAGVRLDLEERSTFAAALAGVNAVFLMRPPAMTRPRAFAPFLDAAVEAGVGRLVFLSVRGVDRVPLLPHHGIEQEVRARPFAWTMLRPADFMQNLETVHRASIARCDEIAVPAGRGRSAFVDVADVGAVAALALTEPGHEGRAHELTGAEALDFHAVAATLSEALGRRVRYRPTSVPRFVWEHCRGGTPVPMALVMSALYTAQRLGLAEGVTNGVERLLGRPPGTLGAYAASRREAWGP